MGERRPTNSELRLQRLEEDAAQEDEGEHGILELFGDDEEPDEDAPLARDGDD